MKICVLHSGSNGNCYLVSENSHYIILDCGIKFETITHDKNFPKFSQIDFVFCGHKHNDHSLSLNNFKQSGCNIISYETLEPKMQTFDLKNWSIITFPIKHDVDNYGIVIKSKETGEKLCYVTDFYAMPKVEGINIWLYEVNYVEELVDQMIMEDKLDNNGFINHNSLENAVEYFSSLKTRPQKIICCHLSASNSIKNIIKKELNEFADEVYIAEKGGIYGE